MLAWFTINASTTPISEKDGTELAGTYVAGYGYRFCIISVRKTRWVKDSFLSKGGYVELDADYVIRDAYTVSDDEVRHGVRAKVVYRTDDLDKAVKFIEDNFHIDVLPVIAK